MLPTPRTPGVSRAHVKKRNTVGRVWADNSP